jgi:hypothetical protein
MDFYLDPGLLKVRGDATDLVSMFYYLLQDSLEAVTRGIRVSGFPEICRPRMRAL